MFVRKTLLFSLLLILSAGIFAQDTDEAIKEKMARQTKLLEEILADAKTLRLPENRALVFARVGNAYWQTDEKKARKLFADAIADTITEFFDRGKDSFLPALKEEKKKYMWGELTGAIFKMARSGHLD